LGARGRRPRQQTQRKRKRPFTINSSRCFAAQFKQRPHARAGPQLVVPGARALRRVVVDTTEIHEEPEAWQSLARVAPLVHVRCAKGAACWRRDDVAVIPRAIHEDAGAVGVRDSQAQLADRVLVVAALVHEHADRKVVPRAQHHLVRRVVHVVADTALEQDPRGVVGRRAHRIPGRFEAIVAAVVQQHAQALVVTGALREHLRFIAVVSREVQQDADPTGGRAAIEESPAHAVTCALSHRRVAVRQLR
jgi:hypothetical protein